MLFFGLPLKMVWKLQLTQNAASRLWCGGHKSIVADTTSSVVFVLVTSLFLSAVQSADLSISNY